MKTLIEWEPEPEPVVEPYVIVAWGKEFKGYIHGASANGHLRLSDEFPTRAAAEAYKLGDHNKTGGPYEYWVLPKSKAPAFLGGWDRDMWPKRKPRA